jgi:hypothetical protein
MKAYTRRCLLSTISSVPGRAQAARAAEIPRRGGMRTDASAAGCDGCVEEICERLPFSLNSGGWLTLGRDSDFGRRPCWSFRAIRRAR